MLINSLHEKDFKNSFFWPKDKKNCGLRVEFILSHQVIHLSNEQNPGCLGYIGDDKLPSYMGITINHYMDPYEPTRIQWKVGGFFSLLIWSHYDSQPYLCSTTFFFNCQGKETRMRMAWLRCGYLG